MASTATSSETSDPRRRKLRFRSWHRGMREVDLILGSFADVRLDALTDTELDQYESLLETPDTVLLPLLTGEMPVPQGEHADILRKVIDFRASMTF